MSSDVFGYPARRRRGFRFAPLAIGLIALACYWVYSCDTGPFGRWQHVTMNPASEARLGAQAFQQVLQESDVLRDPEVNEAVGRVAKYLIRAASDPAFTKATRIPKHDFDWRLSVVRSPEMNAFCLPGGKIVVYTGILPVCDTEAGLAVVMGHEIGHALARHGAERMTHQQMVNIGQMAAIGSISDMDPRAAQGVMMAFNLGTKFGVLLPYSRSHESEADRIGLYLMAIAGYDPANAPRFWERMTQATGSRGQPPEFASTHPGHGTRIRNLMAWQDEVIPIYEMATKVPDQDRRLPVR